MVTDTDPVDVSGVIDRLDDIRLSTGHRRPRIFRDWTALMVSALARNDEDYNERLDTYGTREGAMDTRREVAEAFSEAFGELVIATDHAERPVIGDVYEEIGAQADDFGQYFTPWGICRLKSALITDERNPAAPEDEPMTVSDPACGSGRLLVAGAKRLHEQHPETPVIATGVDKDSTCARMAVINLALAGIPGKIRYGDSLTMEGYREWIVDPTGADPAVRAVDPADYSPDAAPDEQATEQSELSEVRTDGGD
ncbi:N-6 DNA methylase [Halorubrum pallidum]|uniref:site-specific DNA-methyltransferase (adenine-specific) n=1 Tax=Halorubrum pallidum TaxID=1526114 RepID=A0ABD5SYE0_9EURY